VDDVIDQLITNSRQYEQGFAAGKLPTRPSRRLAIVSCMDSRIDLFALLGLRNGEAHVIRNAGGIVTEDVLRSLTLSRWLLGTQHIFVIQHTRCGLHQLAEEELRAQIVSAGPEVPFPFGSFADLAESVRNSVLRLREHPLLAGGSVRGAIYNVDSGRLDEVST
jgi:carbonic anhydrase